ncbi:MAG TPA: cation-translocating P-type ATPase [Clostridiales bacterium]|nr:cation-translocating P-type ATPase [Clostridiales bacterium]
MKEAYKETSTQVLKALNTKREGLDSSKAEELLEKNGKNQLKEGKKKSIFRVFLEQFADLLVIILIIAALISMVTGNVESTIVILCVITLNAILGTVQHFKAEKSLESLKAMSTPGAKVVRSGQTMEISSTEVVAGDIVMLEAGDVVPADGRVIESFSLQVNESALTGEANSVEKYTDAIQRDNVALGDRVNMVFSGSLVTYGRAVVAITETGMDTEIGKIATLMDQTAQRKTPLQVSLDDFSKKLSIVIMIICVIVLGVSLFRGMTFVNALMFAVALAVAAIPEALSSIVTIALAIGTSKMAKQNAIIKNLRAVEGLGCVSVICSDKTGTLTQNKMTVEGTFNFDNNQKEKMVLYSILCNDSVVTENNTIGDPTETALKFYYNKEYGNCNVTCDQYPRLGEIPFDSDRKLMSTVHEIDGKLYMVTKGAVDVLTRRVNYVETAEGIVPLTQKHLDKINEENDMMTGGGLRVLAFAYREIVSTDITLEDEEGYTFVGLISMIDPPREESAQAVRDCISAGIKPVMITGDHISTASAIARKIGILQDGDKAITGEELDTMDDEQLKKEIKNISVYARVSPEHKIRIVSMWQDLGQVVSMTGDGVNDAPALKKADIGIAMGITGTEVSKDAASMILTDDNFATIIKAVANGRNIYANIKNSIAYLLSGNAAGILVVLYCSLLALPIPFTAVQLLFINLITDSLPALAIAMEPSSRHLLKDKPRGSDEALLTPRFLKAVAAQGLLIAVFTTIAFYAGNMTDAATACTMSFATICLARLWHGFNMRGSQSMIRLGFFKNKYSIGAFLIGVLLLTAVMFAPFVMGMFDTVLLNLNNILIVVACSFLPTLLIQLFRMIKEVREN